MAKIKFLNFSFEYSVGAVVYKIERGEILFLLLHYRSGHWDFVKGHKKEGESDIQTLKREALEEVGLRDLKIVANFKKCSYYFYKAKGSERKKRISKGRGVNIFKRVAFYLAKAENDKIDLNKVKDSHEIQGYTWISLEKVLERITHPRQEKILREAIALLQKA